jgi:hypothetical protein
MLRLFFILGRINSQWLTTWTLVAFLSVLCTGYVIFGVQSPLRKKTERQLIHLQLAGVPVPGNEIGKDSAAAVLRKWKCANVLKSAQLAQKIDFLFTFSYGALFLLLSVGLWRCHPKSPNGGYWFLGIACGALAAVFDEAENVFMWVMLVNIDNPGLLLSRVVNICAVIKWILLGIGIIDFGSVLLWLTLNSRLQEQDSDGKNAFSV